MNGRFWCRYAYILVLLVFFHSFSCCSFETANDVFSSAEINNDFTEEQRVNPDPSIERMFLGPNKRRNAISEPKPVPETNKILSRSLASPNHVRVKRENGAKKNNRRSLNEAAKPVEKRAVPAKDSKSSSRSDRSSNVARLSSRTSTDYADEVEDDSSFNAEDDRSAGYKTSEFRVSEDTDGFIDQDERSSVYDDSEAKDVVKRGIASAEDYEESDEEPFDEVEDMVAAQDEGESLEEDTVGRRAQRSEGRVKREHSKREVPVKTEGSAASDDSAKSSEASLKDAKSAKDVAVAEDQASKLTKDSQVADNGQAKQEKDVKATEDQANNVDQVSNDQTDQSKRNIADVQPNDGFKVVPDGDAMDIKQSAAANDQIEAGANDNSKSVNEEHPLAMEEKIDDKISSSNNEQPSLDGAAKIDDTKVAEAPTSDTAKLEPPASNSEAKVSEDTAKYENSLNTDIQTAEQSDREYEKRMEEQIQRKIDSIKEEIKREIAKNEQLKEIEKNNARFDELLDQEEAEEEEEQQAAEAESLERKENLLKRSAQKLDRPQTRSSGNKRSVRLQKRQNEGVQSSGTSNSRLEKKSAREKVGKRSLGSSQLGQDLKVMSPKKRNTPKEVYLVRRDRNAGKRRRRRRSREATFSEMGNLKLQGSSAASGARLRGDLKSQSPELSEDEKALAELAASSGKKSGSVASLTGNAEELSPVANVYDDAFGGLQGEPGLALARFKRIKRVLRPQTSKT